MTTLTYMLEGEFEHEDSKGNKGKIGPGDLQFMIAGKGVVHAEMPIHGPGLKDPFGLQLCALSPVLTVRVRQLT